MLVGDVLHLVYVEHDHDVLAPHRRAPDLDEEFGEGGVGLGSVLRAHGERDARGGDCLDPAQEIADAFLPGRGKAGCG